MSLDLTKALEGMEELRCPPLTFGIWRWSFRIGRLMIGWRA